MHICFVSFDYPSQTTGGGVGTQVQLLAHGFAESGQQVSVIAFGSAKEALISKDDDVLIWRLPPSNLHWYVSKIPLIGKLLFSFVREMERSWNAWRILKKIDRQKNVDAVEIIETGGLFISLFENKKLVSIRLHGEQYTFRKYTPTLPLSLDVRLARLLQRISIRHARLRISPSHAHANEITSETDLPDNEIICLPNVIHPGDDFSKDQTHGKKNILFVGRLEHVKGVPLLLEAFGMLTRQMPDVQLILAGAQHPTLSQTAIEEIVSKNRLQHSIHILGHVPHPELNDWFSKASVLVLPSYYESFGLAALEAMACGIPVVAARVGGLPELIEDGVSGLLFDPGNAQDLASQLTKLLNDDHLGNCLAKTARQRSLKKYNAASIIQKNIDLYRSLLHVETTSQVHLFFSPHFDDVVLSCGGLVKELSRKADVRVITVFGGTPPAESIGVFSRHMHAKWGLSDSKAVSLRQLEDRNAIEQLSVYIQTIHWHHLEAIYRQDKPKRNLYVSYRALRSGPTMQDEKLLKEIIRNIEKLCNGHASQNLQLYFPLGLGGHVDHQVLFKAGQEMAKKGLRVHYYEDWPYVEDYDRTPQIQNWQVTPHPISLSAKIKAAQAYTSQLKGLGGDKQRLYRHLQYFAYQTGDWLHPVERTWQTSQLGTPPPFKPIQHRWWIGDFSSFYRSLGWHDLPEILPPGRGFCLDAGSGNGRHKQTIEERGYTWLGLDLATQPNLHTQASLTHMPFSKNSVEAVVLWQVLEYLPWPHQAITEAVRVLKPGGLLCGSVSFLEPVHGQTFYGISQHALQELMETQGLEDINIQPGISGFSLLLWTWLRRIGGDRLSRIAVPLIKAFCLPPAALLFIISWLQWRFGRGGGHFMEWLTKRAPLEFAGHIHFTARKIY